MGLDAAVRVSHAHGHPTTLDGPFVEVKEMAVGFFLLQNVLGALKPPAASQRQPTVAAPLPTPNLAVQARAPSKKKPRPRPGQ